MSCTRANHRVDNMLKLKSAISAAGGGQLELLPNGAESGQSG